MAMSPAFSPRSVPLTVFHKNRMESVAQELGAPLATSSPVRRTFCSPLPGFPTSIRCDAQRSSQCDPMKSPSFDMLAAPPFSPKWDTPSATRRRPPKTEVSFLAELMDKLHLNEISSSRTPQAKKPIRLSPVFSSSGSSTGSAASSPMNGGRLSPVNHSMRELRLELNSFINESCHHSGTCLAAPSVTQSLLRQDIPRFYFPQGMPVAKEINDTVCSRVMDIFGQFPSGKCHLSEMSAVCSAAGIPVYLKVPMFNMMTDGEDREASSDDFVSFWTAMTTVANDESTRFVYILSQGRVDYVTRADFEPVVMDVVLTHPGMYFLRNVDELHSQYCEVTITVIFWFLGRAFSDVLKTEDIRRSDLIRRLFQLEVIEDVNISCNYFGYMHFYVVSSRFYEVDTDHDLKIDRSDMQEYDEGAIPSVIVDGIFSKEVCGETRNHIGMREFAHFLLADEDKTHPMSQIYWMRVLDREGMTYLTIEKIECLHQLIQQRMSEEAIECLDFQDKLCNIIDALDPMDYTKIRLSDLRKNPQMAPMLLNTLVNWRKFYAQEIKEDFDALRISAEGEVMTPWDIFCLTFYSSQALLEVSSLNDSEGSLL